MSDLIEVPSRTLSPAEGADWFEGRPPTQPALTLEQARNLMEHLDDDPSDICVDYLRELQGKAEGLTAMKWPYVSVMLGHGDTPFFCSIRDKHVSGTTGPDLLERVKVHMEANSIAARAAALRAEADKLERGEAV